MQLIQAFSVHKWMHHISCFWFLFMDDFYVEIGYFYWQAESGTNEQEKKQEDSQFQRSQEQR